jgi:NAD(P)-dependent dehydrogenase (short-subunit alcohol dehydrogenase family)
MARAFSEAAGGIREREIDPFGGQYMPDPPPNPERLVGKVAFITGAAQGVGRETAMLFSNSGIDGVVLVDQSIHGDNVAEMINYKYPDKAIFVQADVSNPSDMENAIKEGEAKFGKINVLFNNAGVMMGEDDRPDNTDVSVWEKTMDINAKGVFLGCKFGIPALQRAGGGSVINVASFVALLGACNPQISYTASKGAVLAFSRELAMIHAKENIRVNSICPGPLRTDLLMNFLNTDEKLDFRLRHIPIGRFGEPKEIAQAVAFLASEESSLMTGSQLVVDGGVSNAYLVKDS